MSDLSALAGAMAAHQIKANPFDGTGYLPAVYFPGVLGAQTQAPIQWYLSDAVAQQIASLLPGATVTKRKPSNGIYASAPDANFIRFADGQEVNAGDIASLAAPTYDPRLRDLSFQCGYEHALKETTSGYDYSPECAAAIAGNATVQQVDRQNASSVLGGDMNFQYTYNNGQAYWGQNAINPTTNAPVVNSAPASSTQVATATPGASVNPAATGGPSIALPGGGSIALPKNTPQALQGLPWWAWAGAAAVGVWMLAKS